jgi:hypothetical protein
VVAQQISQLSGVNESHAQALELALTYQLVTDQTNLILVHVREEGTKAEGLPELDKVTHMQAAGWGGAGSVLANSHAVQFSRRLSNSMVLASRVSSSAADYGSLSTPTVWRARSVASAGVGVIASQGMDDFEIPAFLRKSMDESDPIATSKSGLDPTQRKFNRTVRATPLAVLENFEESSKKILASHRFVQSLQAMNLPIGLVSLVENLTVILGASSKAWAVILQWFVERLSDQITLSRQSERLLRQVLKDEDVNILEELKQTWKAKIDIFMNQELASAGGDDEPFDIPAFLRKQAD